MFIASLIIKQIKKFSRTMRVKGEGIKSHCSTPMWPQGSLYTHIIIIKSYFKTLHMTQNFPFGRHKHITIFHHKTIPFIIKTIANKINDSKRHQSCLDEGVKRRHPSSFSSILKHNEIHHIHSHIYDFIIKIYLKPFP